MAAATNTPDLEAVVARLIASAPTPAVSDPQVIATVAAIIHNAKQAA